jgi:hypothetical protein
VYRLTCIFTRYLPMEHYDMCVSYATKVMPNGKAPGYISERPTTPIPDIVSFARSIMLAPTTTGITSRGSTQVSIQTQY